MKKHIFKTSLALLMSAMLSTSCSIDDPVAGPIVGGGDNSDLPQEEEVILDMDGKFEDWNLIPEHSLASADVPEDAFLKGGKKIKCYAGATFVNLYVEFREDPQHPVDAMHIFIDSDDDQTTGTGSTLWVDNGSDLMFEGAIDNATTYDPTGFIYTGKPLADEWSWNPVVEQGMGICKNSQFVELSNGNKAFEMTILRSAIPSLKKTFRISVGLLSEWNDIALLPAASAVIEAGTPVHGAAEMLSVGHTDGGDQPDPDQKDPSNAQISIDGNFGDWDALDARDIFEVNVTSNAFFKEAHKMRGCYNADFLYLYFELDGSAEATNGILDIYIDADGKFNPDGSAATGHGGWMWKNNGSDYLIQGVLCDPETKEPVIYNPEMFRYTGTPMAEEWAWESVVQSGLVNSSEIKTLPNGDRALECAILRSAVPNMGDDIRLGILVEKMGWTGECGLLPTLDAVDNQHVPAELMHINFNRRNDVDTPVEPEPTPSEAQITIDGDLSDWDKIEAKDLFDVKLEEGAYFTAAREMKACYNQDFIYVYLAYETTADVIPGILDLYIDSDTKFDENGAALTGHGGWLWSNNGSDYFAQGMIYDPDAREDLKFNPELFMYTGAPMAQEWAWTSVAPAGSGIITSAKAVALDDKTKVIEFAILRSGIPNLGNEIRLGLLLEKSGWAGECGLLPAHAAVDGAHVPADMLHINFRKGNPSAKNTR